jgi:hypothetical protein
VDYQLNAPGAKRGSGRITSRRLEYDVRCMHKSRVTGEICGRVIPAGDLCHYYGPHSIYGINCHPSDKQYSRPINDYRVEDVTPHTTNNLSINIDMRGRSVGLEEVFSIVSGLLNGHTQSSNQLPPVPRQHVIEAPNYKLLEAPKGKGFFSRLKEAITGEE